MYKTNKGMISVACQGYENAKSEGKNPDSLTFDANALSHIKHVVGVISGKGGVGKSFVTGSLAVKLARAGYKVGIMDADITGPSIPRMFGLRDRKLETVGNLMLPCTTTHGIKVISANLLLANEDDPVLWRGPVLAGAIRQFWEECDWGELDYLLIDMPPGTGDVALTVFQSLPVESIVIVSSPQDLVQMVVGKAVKMAEKMNLPILGLVENMSYLPCPDCCKEIELYGPSHLQETADHYHIPALDRLPIMRELAEACDQGTLEVKLPSDILNKTFEAVENFVPAEPEANSCGCSDKSCCDSNSSCGCSGCH